MESSPPDPENAPATWNLLFVCSGNTCRSPLARAIAERMARERGWNQVRFESAGTSAAAGAPASAQAQEVAAEQGLDLTSHRSRALGRDVLDRADLVLVMSPAHVTRVASLNAGDRVALVTDFLEGDGAGTAIEDPFGGSLDDYRRTFDQLLEAVSAVMVRLERILAP